MPVGRSRLRAGCRVSRCACRALSGDACSCGVDEVNPEDVALDRAVRRLALLRGRVDDVLAGALDRERHECGYNPLDAEDSCHWADGPDGSACVSRELERLSREVVKAEAEVDRLAALTGAPVEAASVRGVPS